MTLQTTINNIMQQKHRIIHQIEATCLNTSYIVAEHICSQRSNVDIHRLTKTFFKGICYERALL